MDPRSGRKERLSLYLAVAERLAAAGVGWTTSAQLAETLAISPTRIRRDLQIVPGGTGRRGKGYSPRELASAIRTQVTRAEVAAFATAARSDADLLDELAARMP